MDNTQFGIAEIRKPRIISQWVRGKWGTTMLGGVAIGTLAGGFASRLIGSGVQRVGSLVFQKAMRISRIEQAIKTSPLRNANVKAAINDFEVLIGSRYGEYNERLSGFIDELERSGLITALVEDAMLERWSPDVRDSFYALHAQAFSKDQGDPADLYKKLMISFTTTFKELSKDKVAADILSWCIAIWSRGVIKLIKPCRS